MGKRGRERGGAREGEGEGWMIIIQWVWRVMAEVVVVVVVVVVVGWEGCWGWVGSRSGLRDGDRVKGMPRCKLRGE